MEFNAFWMIAWLFVVHIRADKKTLHILYLYSFLPSAALLIKHAFNMIPRDFHLSTGKAGVKTSKAMVKEINNKEI